MLESEFKPGDGDTGTQSGMEASITSRPDLEELPVVDAVEQVQKEKAARQAEPQS